MGKLKLEEKGQEVEALKVKLDESAQTAKRKNRALEMQVIELQAQLSASEKATQRVQKELDRLRAESGDSLGSLQASLASKESSVHYLQEELSRREQELNQW